MLREFWRIFGGSQEGSGGSWCESETNGIVLFGFLIVCLLGGVGLGGGPKGGSGVPSVVLDP